MMKIWEWFKSLTELKIPKLSQRDLILLIVGVVAWSGMYSLRVHFLTSYACKESPSACDSKTINSLDRWVSERPGDFWASNRSDETQNASAYYALGVVTLISAMPLLQGAIAPIPGLLHWITDVALLLEVTVWNGALNEMVRSIVQRPRPNVYRDPVASGERPIHYTSFYSGHTSFAAVMAMALFLILAARRIKPRTFVTFMFGAVTLALMTGVLRVLAGQHFVTDVLFAYVAATFVVSTIWKVRSKWANA